MRIRSPGAVEKLLQRLQEGDVEGTTLEHLKKADAELRAVNFDGPTIENLLSSDVVVPNDPNEEADPGEWVRGWQFKATRAKDKANHTAKLRNANPSVQAKLRSQGGVGAAAWLDARPVAPELRIPGNLFVAGLRYRSFLPMPLGDRHCPGATCGAQLDQWARLQAVKGGGAWGWRKRLSKSL